MLPGAGHLYCGKITRGVTILFFFGLGVSILFLVPENASLSDQTLAEAGLGVAGALYIFSFLDAFFTTREMNSGVDKHVKRNPRAALTLNLLSNGLFGYVYVGRKKRGIATFFFLALFTAVTRASEHDSAYPWLMLAGLLLLTIPALDAYRIARREVREQLLWASGASNLLQAPPGLSPYVPAGLAVLIVLTILVLIIIGLFFPELIVAQH